MALTKSSNPVLSERIFQTSRAEVYGETMTINGTVNKIAMLLFFVVAAASFTWGMVSVTSTGEITSSVYPWMIGGAIGGLILALITVFKPKASPYTAPFYALFEGLFLGGISALMNAAYPGIVMQAVGLTFGVLFAMLFAYKTGLIKVTQKFKAGIVAATGGIMLFYLVTWIMNMFGIGNGFYYGSSLLSIGISLVIVVIAALNLVLDFDFIEKGAQSGAPKYMEWYGAFGLMVTLIWLYVELLRLLAKIANRD
ncbi:MULTISPECIES: Bax inhibitor-1/YccA family protein [Marinifilum]|uniref:Putative YccA/Bax inhibitor family protein n=1 Tax=Marinifilum flexuosum TaxID=1117708 RepID=A0A419X7I6_9BACT|nr:MULTISPECIES: Bax inhibitor-1/YccA family protein [Marinifilum]MCY1632874.1 Bax inhibitor-1/YccA family protein [Marinifilum sp. D737]RKE03626.1 putative YccA/Bax inhibitor family protein [Marinifilum flexuosum]